MGASRVFGIILTATVAASSSSTASLEDAALWLSRFGVDPLLPRLTAYYGDADVQGADTTFRTLSQSDSTQTTAAVHLRVILAQTS